MMKKFKINWVNFYFLVISIAVIVVDQITKNWALTNLPLQNGSQPITSWLSFTLSFNTGAAFSFLRGFATWVNAFFIGTTTLISLALLVWLARMAAKQKKMAASVCVILGGALGNLFDRFNYGYVIDFIHVHYYDWSFPVFNVADAAITIGAVLLLLSFESEG